MGGTQRELRNMKADCATGRFVRTKVNVTQEAEGAKERRLTLELREVETRKPEEAV